MEKVYLEINRTPMMERFVKIINGSMVLTIFTQKLHHSVRLGYKYGSAICEIISYF